MMNEHTDQLNINVFYFSELACLNYFHLMIQIEQFTALEPDFVTLINCSGDLEQQSVKAYWKINSKNIHILSTDV